MGALMGVTTKGVFFARHTTPSHDFTNAKTRCEIYG